MPILRQASATDVALSTKRRVAVICSLVKVFFMVWFLLEGLFGKCPFLTFQVVQFLGDESTKVNGLSMWSRKRGQVTDVSPLFVMFFFPNFRWEKDSTRQKEKQNVEAFHPLLCLISHASHIEKWLEKRKEFGLITRNKVV